MNKPTLLSSLLFLLLFSSSAFNQQLLVTVQQAKGMVAVYDLDQQKLNYSIAVGYKPHEICYDPASGLCFVSNFGVEDYDTKLGTPGKSISVIDPFSGQIKATIFTTGDTPGNMPHGLKVRPGAYKELFVNIERGDSMIVYALDSFATIRKFPVPAGTHNFIFSKNGNRLWLMCGAGGVVEINPHDGKIIHQQLLPSPVRGLAFAGKDILASCKNEIFILAEKDLSVTKHFDNLGVGQIIYSAVSANGKLIICPAVYDSTVLIVNAANGKVLARLKTGKTPLQVQATGNYAYVTHPLDKYITIIDLKNKKISGTIDIDGGNGIISLNKKAKRHD